MARTAEDFEALANAMAPGKSWEEVAVLTKRNARTIARLRQGALKRPTRVTLQSIADGFGCTLWRVEKAVAVSRRRAAARARRATAPA